MKLICYFIASLFVFSFFSCEDTTTDQRTPKGPWNEGPITEYTITPINGGAEITYTLPDNPDVMYVMVEYERNGMIYTDKASVHKNVVMVEGFHRQNLVKATLYKVNKFDQRSEPLEIEFEPLESLIDITFKSLKLQTSFGGIVGIWDNPEATELGVRLMTYDDTLYNKLDTREMYYTQMVEEKHSFRGFEAVETTFYLTFEDKWGNNSDTIQYKTTPFYETMIPKPYDDARGTIPHDNVSDLGGARIPAKLWDNIVNTSGHGWLTKPGNPGISMTIDMKQVAKVSRIIHHPYHINSPYGQANITEMEIWGIDKLDYDLLSNRDYWLDSLAVREGRYPSVNQQMELPERTFKDDWYYMGYHSVPIYTVGADIQALARNGAEYIIDIDVPPVRYIRIFVRAVAMVKPPASNNYWSMSEITFYGDNTVPQE